MICYGSKEKDSILIYLNLKYPIKTWEENMLKKEFINEQITAIAFKHNMIFVAKDNSEIVIYQVISN